MSAAARHTIERIAAKILEENDEHLLNDGPEEQLERFLKKFDAFQRNTPLWPIEGQCVDLAGFGETGLYLKGPDDEYILLGETASALGWPIWKASKWAELQYSYAIRDQRELDEERGDGLLGYECMRDYFDFGFEFIFDDPEAKPDAGGRRWSYAGEWLISRDRIPALMLSSPWSKEFMDNSLPAFGHAMRNAWGDKLKDIPTYTADGQPTGGNAFTDLFTTDGLSEEEALRRARRGPALDGGAE